jgi:hypothetical protein
MIATSSCGGVDRYEVISTIWGMGYWGCKQDVGKSDSFPRSLLKENESEAFQRYSVEVI